MSFFKKLTQFFKTSDELIGLWKTNPKDNKESNWNCILTLRADGKGNISTWTNIEGEETHNHKDLLLWERINKSTILIKLEQESGWTKVQYQLRPITEEGASKVEELSQIVENSDADSTKKRFWNIPVPLYRSS